MSHFATRLLPAATLASALFGACVAAVAVEPVTLENLVAPESNRADEPLRSAKRNAVLSPFSRRVTSAVESACNHLCYWP